MSGRAWGLLRATGLVLAVVLISPLSPLVLVCLPLAVCLLAFHPRNVTAVVLAVVILWLTFSGITGAPSPLWYAERAWALLLAGGFLLVGLTIPERGVLVRSLGGVAAAFGGIAVLAAVRPGRVSELDWWVGSQLEKAASAAWEWLAPESVAGLGGTLEQVVQIQKLLYPAFLALASLASLGIAWYVVTRFAGRVEGLGRFRDFRFSDQLVWLLIVGLLLFLLPTGELAERLGENALVFMGGLYLLRGVAILLWMGAALVTSAWAAVLWAVAALLLYPIVAGAALLLGLSDTWLDLRRRLRRATDAGSGEGS